MPDVTCDNCGRETHSMMSYHAPALGVDRACERCLMTFLETGLWRCEDDCPECDAIEYGSPRPEDTSTRYCPECGYTTGASPTESDRAFREFDGAASLNIEPLSDGLVRLDQTTGLVAYDVDQAQEIVTALRKAIHIAAPADEMDYALAEAYHEGRMDWPQYYVSDGGPDRDDDDFTPAYYRVHGPNGPVDWLNPGYEPVPTTMQSFAMEAQADHFRQVPRDETPYVEVEQDE